MDTILTTLNLVSYLGGLGFAGMFTWFVVDKNLERVRHRRAARTGFARGR